MIRVAIVALVAGVPAVAPAASLGLTRIIDGSVVANPIHVAAPPGDSARLFVLDRSGVIHVYDRLSGTLLPEPFFDNSAVTATTGERGAYAIAFDREYQSNGRLYLSYFDNRRTDTQEFHRVVAITRDPENPNRADPSSRSQIIEIAHARDGSGNHNGGWIGMDADNALLVTTGDSGRLAELATGSPLLGSVLRVDPGADAFPADPTRNYAVPADNLSPAGAPAEVIAEGLRNPYRGGYDAKTGALLVGDVGQDRREEINLVRGGLNYGWPDFEGSLPFQPGFFPAETAFEPPLFEYAHDTPPVMGSSVVGGEVYRGPIAALDGKYFFGDFISGNVLSLDFDGQSLIGLTLWALETDEGAIDALASFGTDAEGNLYALDLFGDVFLVSSAELGTEVPLPAGVWLLLGGLAALGAQRARRKAPTSSRWADQRNWSTGCTQSST